MFSGATGRCGPSPPSEPEGDGEGAGFLRVSGWRFRPGSKCRLSDRTIPFPPLTMPLSRCPPQFFRWRTPLRSRCPVRCRTLFALLIALCQALLIRAARRLAAACAWRHFHATQAFHASHFRYAACAAACAALLTLFHRPLPHHRPDGSVLLVGSLFAYA